MMHEQKLEEAAGMIKRLTGKSKVQGERIKELDEEVINLKAQMQRVETQHYLSKSELQSVQESKKVLID